LRQKGLGTAIAFAIIAFVIVVAFTGGFGRFVKNTQVAAGSMTLNTTDGIEAFQPLTATTTITDGNFDSFDFPLGTTFAGDSVQEFVIGGFSLTSSTTEIRVDFGYGDAHVENSVSAPTLAVIQGSFVIPAGAGLERVPVIVKIPIDKHPFVRVVGDASNGHITMIGVLE